MTPPASLHVARPQVLAAADFLLAVHPHVDAEPLEDANALRRQLVVGQRQVLQPADVRAGGQRPRPGVGDAPEVQVERVQPPQDAALDDVHAAGVAEALPWT